MFRAGVKTAIRSQIRTRGYSTRAFHANKSIYAGVGLSLIAMPFIYGGIANDAKKISKKSKDEAKQDKVEKSEDIQQANGKSEEQGQSEKTIEKKDETKVDGNNQTQESKLEGNDDNEPTSEDYEGAAYNPITGEINWDCPCLGGMAHGPCGEEFKEAFACFVYSEAEPKGIDCIKKFEGMRTCFRRYPEHYKEQLEDEEKMEAEYNNENGETVASAESAATPEVSTPTPIEETTVVETSTKSD